MISLPSQTRHRFGPVRVSARNRMTLEFRQHYPLTHDQRGLQAGRYSTSIYFFFPPSFGLGPATWHPDHFYECTQHFLTYDATTAALARLGNPAHPDHLLQVLEESLARLLTEEAPSPADMVTLARLYSAELSDALNAGGRDIQAILADATATPAELQQELSDYCQSAEASLGALRQLRRKATALLGVAPPDLLSTLSFAEDYGTAVYGEMCGELVQLMPDESPAQGIAVTADTRAIALNSLERIDHFRRRQGFADPRRDGEYYSYRMGLLKKELQQSSYLQTRAQRSDPVATNTAAMVAAGLAATWGTLASLPLLNAQVSLRSSLLFLGLAVGAYVLKDRIKEWVKNRLTRVWRRWDVNTTFKGICPIDGRLQPFQGDLAARARWMAPGAVSREVQRLRGTRSTVHGAASDLERVLCYSQVCRLSEKVPRVNGQGIKETLRVSVGDLLGRLDDPEDRVPCYDAATRCVSPINVPRVYHINVVHVARDEETGESFLGRSRVVVNRQGIVRVEQVPLVEAFPPAIPEGAPPRSTRSR